MEQNYFEELNQIDVSNKIEKKNNLSYLSWAWAWAELKKRYPEASYTIYEDAEGRFYHTDGRTCWVKTGVTVNGIEHIEYLPVMDYKNKSISVDAVTSFDVNKSIQRSLTKAVARHGLGLYVYAGEDLPTGAEEPTLEERANKKDIDYHAEEPELICKNCGGKIKDVRYKNGAVQTAAEFAEMSGNLCAKCMKEQENGA